MVNRFSLPSSVEIKICKKYWSKVESVHELRNYFTSYRDFNTFGKIQCK